MMYGMLGRILFEWLLLLMDFLGSFWFVSGIVAGFLGMLLMILQVVTLISNIRERIGTKIAAWVLPFYLEWSNRWNHRHSPKFSPILATFSWFLAILAIIWGFLVMQRLEPINSVSATSTVDSRRIPVEFLVDSPRDQAWNGDLNRNRDEMERDDGNCQI